MWIEENRHAIQQVGTLNSDGYELELPQMLAHC
jgi:hypothetical protein